ncbi:MAG: Fic family protein [Actinomycetota bacterium]|nr:Fic family protein [Actinomycetota bacterium]
MDASAFSSTSRGEIRTALDGHLAFFPSPLPREIHISSETVASLDEATAKLHRLAGVGRLLPNPQLLIGPHVRLEAVLSSRIEGTEATVSDLLRYEAEGSIKSGPGDVAEVANYVGALDHGLSRLREDFPLALRLIRELHGILMRGVRGELQTPGEFRTTNWIGPPGCSLRDATFVPPPVEAMTPALNDLERFLNFRGHIPLLIQVAMAHYQFEVIHPFLDGNGRVGRLLIPLVLFDRDVLDKPLLYLSAYFERNRSAYYGHLLNASQTGDFEGWFRFFLAGVAESARDAEERTVRLVDLQQQLRDQLLSQKKSVTVVRLAESLFKSPYVTASSLVDQLGTTFPTAQKAIDALVNMEVLVEVTGKPRGRLYYAPRIFDAVYADVAPESSSGDDAVMERTESDPNHA